MFSRSRPSARLLFALALCAVLWLACPLSAEGWKPLFQGVDILQERRSEPRPIALFVVRVDLQAPGVEFLVTPSNGDEPGDTGGQKATTFLAEHGCQLAINASPFSPVGEIEGESRDVLGLSVSRGDVYSRSHGGNGALLITEDNRATIARPPFDTEGVHNAVGGFGLLLEDGVIVAGGEERHPRTAVGVSEDGRYLYLLIIDGRQPGYSVGTTTGETAAILKELGAFQGLNLDGGGSTILVVEDGDGGARILNRPIHNRVPGTERVNGNHLGIFARPPKR